MDNRHRREEITRKLRIFMQGTLEEVHISFIGDIADVNVQWIDGPTVAEVREFIIREIPMLNNIHCERIYSESTVSRILQELYINDITVTTRVEETLHNRHICASEQSREQFSCA